MGFLCSVLSLACFSFILGFNLGQSDFKRIDNTINYEKNNNIHHNPTDALQPDGWMRRKRLFTDNPVRSTLRFP